MNSEVKNVMLVSPNKVKTYGQINVNVDDSKIGAAIRISQDVHLRDVIGQELIERLQQLVYNKIKGLPDSIDDQENEQYKALLDEYVTPTLVYRTAVELCTIMTLKIRNMGVVKNNDTNVQATDAADVKYMSEYYDAYYNDSLNRMMDFLCENKAAFIEVPDGFCTCSRKPRYARTGLYLGK